MASVTEFLERRLRLKVYREKSAVARPWERKFLGYSMTWHKQPRLKVAESSIERLKAKVRVIFHEGRGRSLSQVIKEFNALLRGWMQYFRARPTAKVSIFNVNRRMRNRTSGGVGGRGPQGPLLPDRTRASSFSLMPSSTLPFDRSLNP